MAEHEPQPHRGGGTDTGVAEAARKQREKLAREHAAVPAAESIGKPRHEKQPLMERVFDFKKPNNPIVVGVAATGLVAGLGFRDTLRALFRGGWETLRGVVTGKERKELKEGWRPGAKASGGETHLRPRRTVKETEHRVDHSDHGGSHGHGGEGHGGGHGGGDHGSHGGGGDHGGGGHH